jgi:hypothetical protein
MGCATPHSSVGIMSERPVADEDLTIERKTGVAEAEEGPCIGLLPDIDDVTSGLGVFG